MSLFIVFFFRCPTGWTGVNCNVGTYVSLVFVLVELNMYAMCSNPRAFSLYASLCLRVYVCAHACLYVLLFHFLIIPLLRVDINECWRSVCGRARCRNTPGSYECVCPTPFQYDNTLKKCVGKQTPLTFICVHRNFMFVRTCVCACVCSCACKPAEYGLQCMAYRPPNCELPKMADCRIGEHFCLKLPNGSMCKSPTEESTCNRIKTSD